MGVILQFDRHTTVVIRIHCISLINVTSTESLRYSLGFTVANLHCSSVPAYRNAGFDYPLIRYNH